MKNRFVWASALALAVIINSPIETKATTNGLIIITTRTASDARYRAISSSTLYDGDDYRGPGAFSPGDTAMASLLEDNGYGTRLIPEWLLRPEGNDPYPVDPMTPEPINPDYYYNGGGGPTKPGAGDSNILCSATLVIVSGSGSSSDMPRPNTNGIPIIMGEHSCIGDRSLSGQSSLYLYNNGSTSGNLTSPTTHGLYMRVLAPHHPIMEGIPLDATNRVKIFRDPYPEENAHIPAVPSPKPNYEISWTSIDLNTSVPGAGVTVIGTLDYPNTNKAVFAVAEAGGQLAGTSPIWGTDIAPARLVHLFVNEDGSGGSRRVFNALTVWGRIIFVRTCKWALGETVAPYQGFNIIDVGQVAPGQIKLRWQGSVHNNYRIEGTTDFVNWKPIVDSIVGGTSGTVSRTLDISGGPSAVFMRIAALP